MVKLKVLQWCIEEHGLIRTHDPLLQGVAFVSRSQIAHKVQITVRNASCLPDIEGAFLIGSQGPGPGAHAVVHHLLS